MFATITIGRIAQGGLRRPDRRGRSATGPRLPVDRVVRIMPYGFRAGLRWESARLVDCSRRGVGLLLPTPLPVETQFLMRARLRESVLLIFTVRNCRATADSYRIGAQFSAIIGPPDDRDASVVLDALLEGEDA